MISIPLKITLENIGPITKAELELGQITVIVGENNVGKSFVLKSIYSIFKAFEMEQILLEEEFIKLLRMEKELVFILKRLLRMLSHVDIKEINISTIKGAIEQTLDRINQHIKVRDTIEQYELTEIIESVNEVLQIFNDVLNTINNAIHTGKIDESKLANMKRELDILAYTTYRLNRMRNKIEEIKENIESLNNFEFRLKRAWKILIKDVFSGKLTKVDANYSRIAVNNIILFNFSDESLELSIYSDFNIFKELPKPIFIESPLLLEIRPYLLTTTYRKIKSLEIPIHISSFFDYVETSIRRSEEIEIDSDLDDLIKDLKEIMSGEVYYDIEHEKFYYKSENHNKPFDIQNVASGIKAFGVLQLLLKSGLFENVIYFWEEPESHLHPEWQIKFAEIVAKIVKRNNYFVISTHSPFMVEILRVVAKENEIYAKFYYMDKNSELIEVNDENWDIISDSLLRPLRKIAFRLFRVV